MSNERKLKGWEMWIADHAAPIFLVVAALIVLGAIAVFVTYQKQGDTAETVKVLSPQVTNINRAICDKRSLGHPDRARRCAARIRVGLINCRRSTSCRAAYLALATYPPPAKPPPRGETSSPSSEPSSGSPRDTRGGDANQQPSHQGQQQPGPGKGPESAAEPSPAPPAATGGAGAAEAAKPEETPGNGPPADTGSKSGVDVEACAAGTCVGAEVGVGLGP